MAKTINRLTLLFRLTLIDTRSPAIPSTARTTGSNNSTIRPTLFLSLRNSCIFTQNSFTEQLTTSTLTSKPLYKIVYLSHGIHRVFRKISASSYIFSLECSERIIPCIVIAIALICKQANPGNSRAYRWKKFCHNFHSPIPEKWCCSKPSTNRRHS